MRIVCLLLCMLTVGCASRRLEISAPPGPSPVAAPVATPAEAIDATLSIQRKLDARALRGGGEVLLPSGGYRIEGSLRVPKGVTLSGSWTAPHHADLRTGTVLLAYGGRGEEAGAPLIDLQPGACVRGLTIYYPEQKIESLTPYPWTIRGRGMHCTIENVTLVNPWNAIDFGTEWNELHVIRNVFGCPLKTGVWIDGCSDIGRIENVHFNPHYWFRDEGDGAPRPDAELLFNHLITNADAFVFARTDWEYVLNTFCYGYRAGYRFIESPKGLCNGNFLGIGADGCENAVLVEAAAPYGLLITNGEFVSLRAAEPIQVVTKSTNRAGVVQFNNCSFWGPVTEIARLEAGRTSFVQCNFHFWDARNEGRPAINALGGGLIVQGSQFQRAGQQVRLGPKVRAAVITGNFMAKGENIVNEMKAGAARIEGNVPW